MTMSAVYGNEGREIVREEKLQYMMDCLDEVRKNIALKIVKEEEKEGDREQNGEDKERRRHSFN